MDQPDIVVVEGLVVRPGDLLILNTNESLSKEQIYEIRGRLQEELAAYDAKLLIVCGLNLSKITKEELVAHANSLNP